MQHRKRAAGKGALLDRLLQNAERLGEGCVLPREVGLGQQRRAVSRSRQDFGEWLSTLIAKCGGGSKKAELRRLSLVLLAGDSIFQSRLLPWVGALSDHSAGLYNFTSLIWMVGCTSV